MARTSHADVMVDWEQLTASLLANILELPHLEPQRDELQKLLDRTRVLSVQQDAQKAALQQTTKELTEGVARGRLLATQLRAGILNFYGSRSEKLTEFRMRPYRRRVRSAKAELPAVPPPSPPAT